MKIRIINIPTQTPDVGLAELNTLLSSQRIIHIERQFVADGANSFWSVCVSYLENGNNVRPATAKGEKIDYREVLPEAQFTIYAQLRILRKEIAEKEGLPAYALFTNEQLAEMVRQSASSLNALRKIKGVGAARVDKFGAAFLQILNQHFPQTTTDKSTKHAPSNNLFADPHEEQSDP